MRTTLTLDPDVAQLVEAEMHRQRKPMKVIINEALRRELEPSRKVAKRIYRVIACETKLAPGLDPGALGRLADELEAEAVAGKLGRRRR